MIREIVKDPMLLTRSAQPAEKKDASIAQDLCDTLRAYRSQCVGMAANMIGIPKRIIAADTGKLILVMYNPVILEKKDPYETAEGCLSLSGERKTTRYKEVKIRYQDLNMKEHTGVFHGFLAQILQHEIDHCAGILI